MKKVIFIYPKRSSFIESDIEILKKKFTVEENNYNWINKLALPINLMKQFFFLLRKLKTADYVVISFGGYWSILPSLLGKVYKKPVFIILHGTDCASFHEINYGNMRKPILRYILKISYKYASKLLPVSSSLIYNENTYFLKGKVTRQGYKHFFKNNTTRNNVIHNGIDTGKWYIDENNKREANRFITVLSEGQFILKGGDIIIQAAKKLPQFEFYFIGLNKPENIEKLPTNVQFISKQSPNELLKYYNNSRYYLQLSITEGFGCALAEAMSCGCIPIVSSVNILPDIIGDTGYVLHERNNEELIILIQNITKDKSGEKSREQIVNNYSIQKREKALFKVLEDTEIIVS
tara:strand:+ start:1686 stop:2732 length:1047 start_codon:yes stop_codon:yes gene_type:complete